MLLKLGKIHLPARILARRLPDLHAGVFRALNLLLPNELARGDCLVSRVDGAPDLYLQMLERHSYTSFLRLTYVMGPERRHNPNAHVRVYHDARLAEATAYSPELGTHRLAGPYLSMRGVVERSWRLNRALLKWLDYLLAQGHGPDTMRVVEDVPEFLQNHDVDSSETSRVGLTPT